MRGFRVSPRLLRHILLSEPGRWELARTLNGKSVACRSCEQVARPRMARRCWVELHQTRGRGPVWVVAGFVCVRCQPAGATRTPALS